MVTETEVIEQVSKEIMEVEPEVTEGANTKLTFPYAHNLRLSNFVRFFHPDGTFSTIAAPTFNPQRPTPYRRNFLLHWLSKRGPNGGKWFFLTPQAPVAELPHRCFVAPGGRQCTKRLASIPDLYMHVMAKHGEEAKLYADVLEAMKKKTQAQLDPETLANLGFAEAPTKEGPEIFYCRQDGCPRFFDSEESRAGHEQVCPCRQQAEADVEVAPAVTSETLTCGCGWQPKATSKNPRASLKTHQRLWCVLREEKK